MKLRRCKRCGWEVWSTLEEGKRDGCGGDLVEVMRFVVSGN